MIEFSRRCTTCSDSLNNGQSRDTPFILSLVAVREVGVYVTRAANQQGRGDRLHPYYSTVSLPNASCCHLRPAASFPYPKSSNTTGWTSCHPKRE